VSAISNPAGHGPSARHVRRLRMRVPDGSWRLRVENLLEEALRLTTLPGEDEGRVYFFRQLRLPGLDPRDSPMQWIVRCSQHLLALSHTSEYGCTATARNSPAIYFHHQNEPRRRLLARMLAGENPQEWYWPLATGVAGELPPELRLEQVLEQWRVQPAAWAGVARELIPALDARMAQSLVEKLRPAAASRWLAALRCAGGELRGGVAPPLLRTHARLLVSAVRAPLAECDPRLLFFAVLAVLDAAPAAPQEASLLALATGVLRQSSAPAIPMRDVRGRLHRATSWNVPRAVEAEITPPDANRELAGTASGSAAFAAGPDAVVEHRTRFAGLYFLLHALRHAGIAEALEQNPQLVHSHFVSRVLLRLAVYAGVGDDDPILWPLLEDLPERPTESDDAVVMPANLPRLQRLRPRAQLTERLWSVAVRRWCRRQVRMPMSEIVGRPGRIFTSATNIEITMPMATVDLSIRRAGLDLDPGYVPWFGRVLHFHYHVEAQS